MAKNAARTHKQSDTSDFDLLSLNEKQFDWLPVGNKLSTVNEGACRFFELVFFKKPVQEALISRFLEIKIDLRMRIVQVIACL